VRTIIVPAAAALAVLVLAGCGSPPHYSLPSTKACLQKAGLAITPPTGDFVAESATVGSFRATFTGVRIGNAVTILFGRNAQEAKDSALGYIRFHAKNVGVYDILFVDKNVTMLWKEHASLADRATVTGCLK
jgi:hypothetical protein